MGGRLSGRNAIHPYPVRCKFKRHDSRELSKRSLRTAIGRAAFEDFPIENATYIDNPATLSCFDHALCRTLGADKRGGQVDGNDIAPLAQRHGEVPAAMIDPGIVDEDIHSTEFLDELVDNRSAPRRIDQIDLPRRRAPT